MKKLDLKSFEVKSFVLEIDREKANVYGGATTTSCSIEPVCPSAIH